MVINARSGRHPRVALRAIPAGSTGRGRENVSGGRGRGGARGRAGRRDECVVFNARVRGGQGWACSRRETGASMLEQESGGMGNRSPGLSPLNQRALHHGAATELCCAALPACRAVLCLLCPHHSTSGYCILGRPPPNAYTRPPSVAAAARLPRAVPKGASGCQAPPNAPAHLRGCGPGGWGGWVGGWSDAAGRCLEAGTTRQPTGPASRHPTNRAPGGTRAAGAAPEPTPQRRWSRNQQAARGEGVPPGARRHLLFLPGGAASGLPTDPAHSDTSRLAVPRQYHMRYSPVVPQD